MLHALSKYLFMCGLPCGWSIICLLGYLLHVNIIRRQIYFKPQPQDGFASDEARKRFYQTSDQRKRKRFRATVITWPSIWAGGGIVGFILITFFNSFTVNARAAESTTSPEITVTATIPNETPTPEFTHTEQISRTPTLTPTYAPTATARIEYKSGGVQVVTVIVPKQQIVIITQEVTRLITVVVAPTETPTPSETPTMTESPTPTETSTGGP